MAIPKQQSQQILDFPPNGAQFQFHFRCRHEREIALSVFPIPLTLLSMVLTRGGLSRFCVSTRGTSINA